jgi:tRNA dimethylallyltransferase
MEKVYVILGCTACGKGAVGRELARRLGARILSVDSMKVYRRMDIGTAKPSRQVRSEIPHYGIDIVEPCEAFSVAQYVHHADAAISQTSREGVTLLAVGGTSLYLKALTEGLFEGPSTDEAIRAELSRRAKTQGLAALHAELAAVDERAAERIHPNDEKRIIRALEVYHATGQPISRLQTQWETQRRYDCVLIGLRREKEDLHRRINVRVRTMVEAGLREEVERLLAEPGGLSRQAAQGVGYAEMIEHLQGRCDFDQAVEDIKINTRRLAKKQRTWHRRWRETVWFDLSPDEPAERTADRIQDAVPFGKNS